MILHKLIDLILSNHYIKSYIKNIYDSYYKKKSGRDIAIAEIAKIKIRKSEVSGRRLNLIIPALSSHYIFGGISTALNFFMQLGFYYEDVRIILSDESDFNAENNPDYQEWIIRNLDEPDCPGKLVVAAGNRYGKTLAVRKDDLFIATAWWTSYLLQDLLENKRQIFSNKELGRFIYIIQDYEPGFYPWSSRYSLAESTYSGDSAKRAIAIFNSSILYKFFKDKNYTFGYEFFFEPKLNIGLISHLKNVDKAKREKKILVYGRPSTQRNAFEIIVMGLREFVAKNEFASQWVFKSAGELHEPIELGNNCHLESLGKLNLEDYAGQLLTSYVGISLMVSPHPSYPPLEMATFGLRVINNKYDCKDLSELSENIITVDFLSPSEIALKLSVILLDYDADPFGRIENNKWFQNYLKGSNELKSIASAVHLEKLLDLDCE